MPISRDILRIVPENESPKFGMSALFLSYNFSVLKLGLTSNVSI